jgi:hypothetical protein
MIERRHIDQADRGEQIDEGAKLTEQGGMAMKNLK